MNYFRSQASVSPAGGELQAAIAQNLAAALDALAPMANSCNSTITRR